MAVELGAQTATLNDQRSHIDVLDTALSNAQANVVKLQEEVKEISTIINKIRSLVLLQTNYH